MAAPSYKPAPKISVFFSLWFERLSRHRACYGLRTGRGAAARAAGRPLSARVPQGAPARCSRGLSAAGESLQNGGVQLGFVLFHGDSHRDLCFYRLESQNGEVCCALCVVSSLVFNCDTNTEVQESSYLCSKDLPATPLFFFLSDLTSVTHASLLQCL